jgi:hypothetical protein
MKYIFDFDLTLLNTDALKERVFSESNTALVGTADFWCHYNAMDFLYDDVLPWLKKAPKNDVHILTAYKPSQGPGAEAFQCGKVESGGFAELVESVTVMDGMKGPYAVALSKLFPDQEAIVFVDDRLDQCLSVKESLPNAHVCLIVRNGVFPESLPEGISLIKNLADLDGIIKTL